MYVCMYVGKLRITTYRDANVVRDGEIDGGSKTQPEIAQWKEENETAMLFCGYLIGRLTADKNTRSDMFAITAS